MAHSRVDHHVSHVDCVGGNHRRSGEVELALGLLPSGGAVELKDAPRYFVVRVGTGDIDPLALALDELFDFLDVVDWERDCICPSLPL